MAQKFNSLERFWQELKRRKTGKVIVAYAATAFILLQLADILTPALLLPEWTMRLVTLLLIIGFPIAIIFSWVFDITPEGIKKTESIEASEIKETLRKPAKRTLTASNIIIAALIIVVAVLTYPKIFKRDTLEKLRSSGDRISVAVMPFQNMTNDTIWNVWQDGVQTNMVTSLSSSVEELRVRQTESITRILQNKGLTNYASITPSVAGTISQKLDADVFISGSINQSGSTIRLNAQLIDSKNEDVLKSFQVNGTAENILSLLDSLSMMVKNFLLLSRLKNELAAGYNNVSTTNSPEAFRYFIYGRNEFRKWNYPAAWNWLYQAISVDSNFTDAITMLSLSYRNEFESEKMIKSYGDETLYDKAKEFCLKAYEKRDQMPPQEKINTNWIYAGYFETPNEEIKYLKQLLDFDDMDPIAYFNLGNSYFNLYQYDKAIPEFEKALGIYKKWGLKPYWIFNYTYLGECYRETGQYKKAKKIYKLAEKDFPDDPTLILDQAILSEAVGDTIAAKRYIEKGNSFAKSVSMSDASVATILALAYTEVERIDKAEKYYRQAFSLESESPVMLNDLAYFLIDKDRNINEGMELVEKALKLRPEYYLYLHTKGWGLYKQRKYKEALKILQRSWDLRRQHAIYDHEAYLHLEVAKKAVAGQKYN
jgi:tetratricopeptide (TPR) repeat protein